MAQKENNTLRTMNQQTAALEYLVSDRFVKKNIGGSPTGKRVEAPQALTCNTNTGARIDPPRSSNRRRLGGQKNHWEG